MTTASRISIYWLCFIGILLHAGCTVEMNPEEESNDSETATAISTDSSTESDPTLSTDSDSTTDTVDTETDTGTDTDVPGCTVAAVNGSCANDNVVYCEDAGVKQFDCSIVGETCGIEDDFADCHPVERLTACGELTALGDCDSNDIRWCDETRIMAVPVQYDCGIYGRICDPTAAADGGAICTSHGDCGNIDEMGSCDGNVLSYCDAGELFVFDCGADVCQTVDDLADCFSAGVLTDCGEETVEGRCDGNEVVSCLGGTVTREDCGILGMQCVEGATAQCEPDASCAAGCASGYTCDSGVCTGPQDETREWTIAVYMVGDNNLSNAVWQDLNEMEAASLNDSVTVVTEFELSSEYTSFAPVEYRSGAYRMAISPDNDTTVVGSIENAENLGDNIDMTDPAHVSEFIRYAAETYPSKRIAVLFWDHGLGWRGGFVDTRSSGTMSLVDIVSGVRDSGTHPDLVAFDACMMGMHEVALALRGVTDTMVASEEAVPGGGLPYDSILSELSITPDLEPLAFGSLIAGRYTNTFETGLRARSVTMSVLDLNQIVPVNSALADFSAAFIEDLPGRRPQVRGAIRSGDLLRYRQKDSADLISTMDAFAALGGGMGDAATLFSEQFESSMLVVENLATLNVAASSGVAIHLPANAFSLYGTHRLDEYQESTQFLPLEPWYSVLANLTETSSGSVPTDGLTQFKVDLQWTNTDDSGASSLDLDLIIVEPSGEEAAAANGSVTSNGLLSADSFDSGISQESYLLREDHQSGVYVILVHLYMDDTTTITAEQAHPQITISFEDEQLVRLRGYGENRAVVQVPMDMSAPFEGTIQSDTIQQVLDLNYSTLWYVATLQIL
ncbi:MAG: hypothetical protein JXX29_02210 [Deltaproteobacteria bacterium]|nr:hypothetical protein [Deltaproteobacteria bacterium]MBN2670456.1 hypothetical protein [Deltaproteobacteria bacterium]